MTAAGSNNGGGGGDQQGHTTTTEGGAIPPRSTARIPRALHARIVKTRMCLHFSRGACDREGCRFAHCAEELREKPDLHKTRLCAAFAEGNCKDGDDCKFAHDEHELRSTAEFYKTALCEQFRTTGTCKSGDQCRFAHGRAELRPREDDRKHRSKANHNNSTTSSGSSSSGSTGTSTKATPQGGSPFATAKADKHNIPASPPAKKPATPAWTAPPPMPQSYMPVIQDGSHPMVMPCQSTLPLLSTPGPAALAPNGVGVPHYPMGPPARMAAHQQPPPPPDARSMHMTAPPPNQMMSVGEGMNRGQQQPPPPPYQWNPHTASCEGMHPQPHCHVPAGPAPHANNALVQTIADSIAQTTQQQLPDSLVQSVAQSLAQALPKHFQGQSTTNCCSEQSHCCGQQPNILALAEAIVNAHRGTASPPKDMTYHSAHTPCGGDARMADMLAQLQQGQHHRLDNSHDIHQGHAKEGGGSYALASQDPAIAAVVHQQKGDLTSDNVEFESDATPGRLSTACNSPNSRHNILCSSSEGGVSMPSSPEFAASDAYSTHQSDIEYEKPYKANGGMLSHASSISTAEPISAMTSRSFSSENFSSAPSFDNTYQGMTMQPHNMYPAYLPPNAMNAPGHAAGPPTIYATPMSMGRPHDGSFHPFIHDPSAVQPYAVLHKTPAYPMTAIPRPMYPTHYMPQQPPMFRADGTPSYLQAISGAMHHPQMTNMLIEMSHNSRFED